MTPFKIVKEIFTLQVMIWKFRVQEKFCLVVTVIAALLVGCAILSPTDHYAPVPDSRLSSVPQNHPQPSISMETQLPTIRESLTLDRAIQIALANNPEIAATQWDLSAAASRLDAARANRWPTLSAEGSWQRYLDAQRLIPASYNGEPGVFDQEIYQGGLVVKLPLFTGGRITNEISAAELFVQSEEKRLARTREELIFNVSSIFYAMLGQREVIRSLEFSTDAMQEHHKQVSDLLTAQKAARVDLLRTEVRLADLHQSLVKEQNILAIEKRMLANLMGVDEEVEGITIDGTLFTEPALVRPVKDLIPTALKRRSDYLAAHARLEAQARRVDAARAGHWPTINLLGSYGVKGAPSPEDEGRDTEPIGEVGNIGIALTVPLFEGGRTVAQVRQERAALAAAQERLRKLELQIRQEVETAVLDIQSSSERIRATRQSIEQAQESLRIERMKYDLGSGSMTDVLDAQSALLQSETNFARALADHHIAIAKLRLATGEDS